MSDEIFIYVVIALNIIVQLMLIRSLRFPPGAKKKYYLMAVAIPAGIMIFVRVMIAAGLLHKQIDEQSAVEHVLASMGSVAILASPWFVTAFAIIDRERRAWIRKLRQETDEPV